MDRFTRSYPWALAVWLIIATAAAFLLLANALSRGQMTLG
jgi:F0F1-type ATP synthase assembly protein I